MSERAKKAWFVALLWGSGVLAAAALDLAMLYMVWGY